MDFRFCDELEFGFGWEVEGELIHRTSHALAADGGVWLIDPVDVTEAVERARRLGEMRAVVQLVDRHDRDCEAVAERLGVLHFNVPFFGVPHSPFEVVSVADTRLWREVALWWPEERVLVCGEALGTLPYFLAPGDRLGVHPLLRVTPPRVLAAYDPLHILVGHGEGVHGEEARRALEHAVASARRRLPRTLLRGIRGLVRRG
jgi:hypothetical protein